MQTSKESSLEIIQTPSVATFGSARPLCLYRGGPPPLAADATVVEGSHLHLHEGNGELVAFPVVPVNTLPEKKCHFGNERFREDIIEKDSTSSTKKADKSYAVVVTEEVCNGITFSSLISISRKALLLSALWQQEASAVLLLHCHQLTFDGFKQWK